MSIDPSRRPATPILPQSFSPTPATPNPTGAAPKPVTEAAVAESNHMLVGREVSLSGKIGGCNRILIEGKVEATLECVTMDVAGPGTFNGTATVDEAEISGKFEGTLTVRKRLLIRASGQVSGTIRYGQLEVELGGRIAGDVDWQNKL